MTIEANVPVWEDGEWSPLPLLMADIDVDSCVVGLGGSGLTAIGELLARGQTVAAIDASDVGAGAAGRNGGFLLAGQGGEAHGSEEGEGNSEAGGQRSLFGVG